MKNLRFKLLVSLTVFAVILVTVVTFTNRELLKKEIQKQTQRSWELIENHILADMQTIDNAHYYLEADLTDQMESALQRLNDLYEVNKDPSSWNLETLKKDYKMEFYVLNDENKIINTTFTTDLGLNFNECCKKFAQMLDERRTSGEFYSDGMDISTQTGQTWKYSYLGTTDKKYLLEVGINGKDIPLYKKFNFFDTAANLVNKYDDLLEIKIIHSAGYYLNFEWHGSESIKNSSIEFQAAFKEALNTFKPVQYKVNLANGYIETNRFIPYKSEHERGFSTKRVIFAKYNNETELELLDKNMKQFWSIIIVAVITSLILLFIISKLLTGTIKLATLDPLTGVYNRTSYLSHIESLLRNKNKKVGLLVLDLDNFKQVNDQYGHVVGDTIIIEMAKILLEAVGKDGFVVRFGGDEFAIVIENASVERMQLMSDCIMSAVHCKKVNEESIWSLITVSIGGAIQGDMNETEMSLFMRADKALYESKNLGKDRYTFFNRNVQSSYVDEVTTHYSK